MSEPSVPFTPEPLPEPFRRRVPYAALALDLDGTLLDPDSRLTPRAVAGIRRLTGAGVKVFINTGRAMPSPAVFHRELGLDTPLGLYNGAKAAYPDGRSLYERSLPGGLFARVAAWCRPRGWQVNFYNADRVFSTHDNEAYRWYRDTFRLTTHFAGPEELESLPATKFLVIVPPEEKERAFAELSTEFGGDAAVTTSGPRFVEILPPGVDKSLAMRAIAEELAVPLDRVVAAGDHANDVEMIRHAGLGVSVATAEPSARAAADWVLPPLWDDGLAILAREAFGV